MMISDYDENFVIVNTNYGQVRGRKRIGVNKNIFYSFQKIPYARPPLGELRFKDPMPPSKWHGILDGTKEGPCAFGTDAVGYAVDPNSNEDCLHLNIYTKEIKPQIGKPVMVSIHGGGFATGSSSESNYGADFFMEKEIVLITLNFRLGALGFLSIPDSNFKIPGNAGLKDQSMALRWIRQNCFYFGGDPENVTLFGGSAGGAAVHFHMLSDYSRGLFHKAIIHSGSVLCPWANRSKTKSMELNERLAKKLGWNGQGGINDMVKILQKSSATDITINQIFLTPEEKQSGHLFAFVPIIEPYDYGSCFIPRSLAQMNRKCWTNNNKIPLIIGGNSDEGYLMHMLYKRNPRMFMDDGYFDNAIPREMNIPEKCEERKMLGVELKKYYYDKIQPSFRNIDIYCLLTGDKYFWHPIVASCRARVEQSAPTYLCRFSFKSEQLKLYKKWFCDEDVKATIHGEDLLYLFRAPGVNDNLPANCDEHKIRNVFINMYTHFAHTGNPNYEQIKHLQWQSLSKDQNPYKCFNIDKECSVIELPETKRVDFWNCLHSFGF